MAPRPLSTTSSKASSRDGRTFAHRLSAHVRRTAVHRVRSDLIIALGADRFDGERHYLATGRPRDARSIPSTGTILENYPDVRAAFGNDGTAATVHYIEHGFAEGRTDNELPAAAATDFLF